MCFATRVCKDHGVNVYDFITTNFVNVDVGNVTLIDNLIMAVFLLGDTNRHRLTHSSIVCHS